MKQSKGFTLIELLIVVAIIAILAAIGIYNYMGAQTRAKVARAKSELKTVVLALEAYHVDYGTYPPYHYVTVTEFFLGGWADSWGVPLPFDGANPITTPIAYITTMPNDPFYNKADTDPYERRNYGYVNWDQAVGMTNTLTVFQDAQAKFGSYRIHSLGPDRFGPNTGIPYDPSNGWNSTGDIFYSPNITFDTYVKVTA